jgi:hypothetical protein
MTKLEEMIEVIRAENPNGLRVGNDELGYTFLTEEEYETTVTQWASARIAKEAKIAETKALEETKPIAQAKLAALGLTPDDLKALGL